MVYNESKRRGYKVQNEMIAAPYNKAQAGKLKFHQETETGRNLLFMVAKVFYC